MSCWKLIIFISFVLFAFISVLITKTDGCEIEMVAEGENGLLAQPGNPVLLSEAMKELLENPEKLKAFGQASLQRQLEHFSLQSYIGNFSTLYREIL